MGLWLPAREQRQKAAWTAAGARALARVALPPSYSPITSDGPSFQVCPVRPDERCFLGPGDPEEQVATVKAGLAAVATGSVTVTCHPVELPGAPPSCRLSVPVAGSRLLVGLFARPVDRSKHVAQWTYDGAYVQMLVDQS